MEIKFKIDHIDALGQGVSKLGDKVTFIHKTLPNESGTATIYRKAKGVQFAYIKNQTNISEKSELRTDPACEHFDLCNGCHFLHTSYENELNIKMSSFERLFSKFELNVELKSVPSKDRLGYRNRIQLHYNKNQRKMGFINKFTNEIIEVPRCQIIHPALKEQMEELYGSWQKLVQRERNKGHIELYVKDNGKVKITINKRYAEGGFSQVNEYGNGKLHQILEDYFTEIPENAKVLDLFGGAGNLSKNIAPRPATVVDYSSYSQDLFNDHQTYIQADLYSENEVQALIKRLDSTDVLIIDPPRKGFSELSMLVDQMDFETIIYVSCNPGTMIRDIMPLREKYQIDDAIMLDFFPSTYHFESVVKLSKTNR